MEENSIKCQWCSKPAIVLFKNGKGSCSKNRFNCPKYSQKALPYNGNELCYYGCGNVAMFVTRNKKHLCSETFHQCPIKRKDCRRQMSIQTSNGKHPTNKGFKHNPLELNEDSTLNCKWCGMTANFKFKNGDGVCSNSKSKCPAYKTKTVAWIKTKDEDWLEKFHHDRYESAKKSLLKKHGSIYPVNSEKSKKQLLRRRDESYDDRVGNFKHIIPLFTKDEFVGYKKLYKWKCVTCDLVFKKTLQWKQPMCPKCKITHPEQTIIDALTENKIKFILHDRILLNPKEIDIFLPEFNIGIEIHGVYWHSLRSKNHMLEKTELSVSKGIKLLQIFEDEIEYKPDIVINRILNMVGKSTRIYARKCELDTAISRSEKSNFLNDHHIQGSVNAIHTYGLRHDGELVCIMTFSRPRGNNLQWDLNRFCNRKDCTVVGGASKLLKAFRDNFPDEEIISFADRRWSSGALYEKLGFRQVGVLKPSYWYFKRGECIRFHKFGFSKQKQSKKFNSFDPYITEWKNMQNNGYSRIYDCGLIKYELPK